MRLVRIVTLWSNIITGMHDYAICNLHKVWENNCANKETMSK